MSVTENNQFSYECELEPLVMQKKLQKTYYCHYFFCLYVWRRKKCNKIIWKAIKVYQMFQKIQNIFWIIKKNIWINFIRISMNNQNTEWSLWICFYLLAQNVSKSGCWFSLRSMTPNWWAQNIQIKPLHSYSLKLLNF